MQRAEGGASVGLGNRPNGARIVAHDEDRATVDPSVDSGYQKRIFGTGWLTVEHRQPAFRTDCFNAVAAGDIARWSP